MLMPSELNAPMPSCRCSPTPASPGPPPPVRRDGVFRSHVPPHACALKFTGANAVAAAVLHVTCAANRKSKENCCPLYGVTR